MRRPTTTEYARTLAELVTSRPYTARQRIAELLRKNEGRVGKTATEIGICRRTLTNWIARLGLRAFVDELVAKRSARTRDAHREMFRIYRELRNKTPEGRAAMYRRRLRQLAREKAARAAARAEAAATTPEK